MRSTTPSLKAKQWFDDHLAQLWPVALGSLSLRRSPCVRKRCSACERGEQHQSYVLYARVKGRRLAVYVPEDLVPEVERALQQGHQLQALLHEAGVRYTKALKRERKRQRRARSGEGEEPR